MKKFYYYTIFVYYYTGNQNGDIKQSKRIFHSFKTLYNNLHTFKNLKSISIYNNNECIYKTISGHYNIIDYLKKHI